MKRPPSPLCRCEIGDWDKESRWSPFFLPQFLFFSTSASLLISLFFTVYLHQSLSFLPLLRLVSLSLFFHLSLSSLTSGPFLSLLLLCTVFVNASVDEVVGSHLFSASHSVSPCFILIFQSLDEPS